MDDEYTARDQSSQETPVVFDLFSEVCRFEVGEDGSPLAQGFVFLLSVASKEYLRVVVGFSVVLPVTGLALCVTVPLVPAGRILPPPYQVSAVYNRGLGFRVVRVGSPADYASPFVTLTDVD